MRPEAGIGEQHHHVGVVMREAAVLFLLGGAARVDDAGIGRDDDVRCAGIAGRRQAGRVVVMASEGP